MAGLFTCARCKYETNKISTIKSHFNRKTPCNDDSNCGKTCLQLLTELNDQCEATVYTCAGCDSTFQSIQGRSRHWLTCKDYIIFQKDAIIREKDEIIKEKDAIIAELNQRLTETNRTTTNINPEINGNHNNITTNVTNITNNNITFVLNDFGNEDISYIVNDTEFLDECLKDLSTSGIENVIEKIYFNNNHPENKTVFMKSLKHNLAMVRIQGKWTPVNINNPATNMVRTGRKILASYYTNSGKESKESNSLEEEGDYGMHPRKIYLTVLGNPKSNEHIMAVSKAKSMIKVNKFV